MPTTEEAAANFSRAGYERNVALLDLIISGVDKTLALHGIPGHAEPSVPRLLWDRLERGLVYEVELLVYLDPPEAEPCSETAPS
jgi:hypothetical protein